MCQLREAKEYIAEKMRLFRKDCQYWDSELPVIYIVTPTYARPVQKAELTR